MKVKVMIAMVLAVTLSLGYLGYLSSANAEEVVWSTYNAYEDKNPQTANGCVVWQGEVEKDNWEIFLYNAGDGTGPDQVTTTDVAEGRPHTDCQYITWAAVAEGGDLGEIFLYEIATDTPTQITSGFAINTSPRVGNGWVVWESNYVNNFLEPGQILAYDIGNGVITNISGEVDPYNEFDDHAPRLDGNLVFWSQRRDGKTTLRFVYDLAAGKTKINRQEDIMPPNNPQVDGDLRSFFTPPPVVGDDDNEIFLLHNKIGTIRITDNTIDDRDPYLADGILAWVGGTGSDQEIYVINFNNFDSDEDGVADVYDTCPETASGDLVDPSDGCSINQICPCDDDYQSCVAITSGAFVRSDLLTEAEADIIIETAAKSECGM